MTEHQKRLSAPESWPVARKTATFTVKAAGGPHGDDGVPLVIVLRDVLGYVDSTKEAKYAVNTEGVLVNGEPVGDARRPVGMFDILSFPDREEHYRIFPGDGGRLGLTAIDADAAASKLSKVEDKTLIDGGRVQLNLHDGSNLIVEDDDYDAGDSIVVSNDDQSIVAHFEYEEGALVTAVDGEHAGEIGTVDEIEVTPGSAKNNVHVETETGEDGDGDTFETVEEFVVVIDENFTADEGESAEPELETGTENEETEASEE
jgi:small subunit ribosomal protein S4e